MSNAPVSSSTDPGLSTLGALRRKGILTEESAKELAKAGEELRIRGTKVKWDEVMDRYEAQGELGAEDLNQILDFTATAQVARKTLEKKLKTEAHRTRYLEKLARLDAYLEPA